MMGINELEYLTLEGGGGKGAVYQGAILALEKLMYEEWKKGGLTRRNKDGSPLDPSTDDKAEFECSAEKSDGKSPERNHPSLLDYYDGNKEALKIKGISGASAGAITAFPLNLGLTSCDIRKILRSYPFSEEFLPNNQLHEGKYRMAGMNADGHVKLLIAEDHFRKLGEDKIVPYFFSGKQKIGSNPLKSGVRDWITSAALSVIYTGVKENWAFVSVFFKRVDSLVADYNYLKKISVWLKSNVVQKFFSSIFNSSVSKTLAGLVPIPWNKLIKTILKLKFLNKLPWGSESKIKIKDLLPADNIVSAIGNLLWDRGIYAGFEIREFFYRVLLMSLSKNTHFKRSLLRQLAELNQGDDLPQKINVTEDELENFIYEFGDDPEDKKYDGSRVTFTRLSQLPELLTFKVFHKITGVNLCICVTNSTTGQPVYFSHYFTPDFPVLEALGASMSFPIAFKPVYNEANVLKCDVPYKAYTAKFKETASSPPVDLFRIRPHDSNPSLVTEIFTLRNFNKYQTVVLRYVKKEFDLKISVNGNLSFRSFLPYLIKIIHGDKFHSFTYLDESKNSRTFDSANMKFLCCFFYNSAFKGLFFDGGATNNLPMGVFAFNTEEMKDGGDRASSKAQIQNPATIKNTLALKLDNSFPEALRTAFFELVEKEKGDKIIRLFSDVEDKSALSIAAIRILASPRIKKHFQLKKSAGNDDLLKEFPDEVRILISKELARGYKLSTSGFTPWNKQNFIVAGLVDALSFGMDQGQIQDISDNENIIPLYCYGLGVFDFDLTGTQIKPLVELANVKSESSVFEYFGAKPETSLK